jgi:beta-galactosidase
MKMNEGNSGDGEIAHGIGRREFLRSVGIGGTVAGLLSAGGSPPEPSESAQREHETITHFPGARYFSGPWRLHLDPGEVGKDQKWYEREPSDAVSKTIGVRVPSCWQEYVPDYANGGVGWYFKDFYLPRALEGRVLRVRFWAVDYFAEVWVNGQGVGSHEGGHTPFEVDITRAAKVGGNNRLVVRVVDPPRPLVQKRLGFPGWEGTSDGIIDGFNFSEIPEGLQSWQEGFNISGIWQLVELLETDPVYIQDVFIEPNLTRSQIVAHAEVVNGTAKRIRGEVVAAVRPWNESGKVVDKGAKTVALDVGVSRVDLSVDIRDPHAWSPEDPYLYVAEVRVQERGNVRDRTQTRFGLREFTVKEGRFYLNGKRLFIKGGQHQRTYPTTLAYPPTWEFAYREIQIFKDAGFNFCRMAINPPALPFIDAADELGLLLQQDMALSNMKDSRQLLPRGLREVKELVARDRNRPSIVIWCMVNEMAPALKVVKQLARAARESDPTRLVTECTGGRTHYYLPYSKEGISYLDEHYYPGAPIGEDVYKYCNQRGILGQLYFPTEFGFGGMNDIDSVLADYGDQPRRYMEDYRGNVLLKELREKWFNGSELLKQRFGDLRHLMEACQTLQAEAVRRLAEALRANPAVSGYDYCQVFDSNAVELDGLVDFWRHKRKPAFYAMQELNRPLVLIISCSPWNSRSGEEVKLKVTLVNEGQIAGTKKLTVRVQSPSGRQVYDKEVVVDAQPWVSVPFHESVQVSGESQRYTVEAALWDGTTRLTGRQDHFTSFKPDELRWPSRPVAIFDPEHRLEPFLEGRGIPYRSFGPEIREPTVIVVAPFTALWRQSKEFQQFMQFFVCAERGCTVLMLGLPHNGPELTAAPIGAIDWLSPLAINTILPSTVRGGKDHWRRRIGPYSWGMFHPKGGFPLVAHPIYEGIPNYGLMGADFGNVAPTHWMEADALAEEDLGPTVKIYRDGKGKVILSSLNLIPSLSSDALAEKVLCNLVKYADQGLPGELAPEQRSSVETLRFEEKGDDDCLGKSLEPGSKV